MAGLMTFWDVVLQKCAGKGAYDKLQLRMIEADMRDIETPSNSDRPSVRFLYSGEASPTSPVSSIDPATSFATSVDGTWELQPFDVPHARVQDILEERRKRPTRIPEPQANLGPVRSSSPTAEGIIASPFDPSLRKDRLKLLASKPPSNNPFKKVHKPIPFFCPVNREESKYAGCAPGRVGEEARARMREGGEAKPEAYGMDPYFFAEIKEWLQKDYPNFKFPEPPAESADSLRERDSELAFLRKRPKETPRPPMREYIDEDGIIVQVGFESLHEDPLRPLTNRELEDVLNFSSSVRRISVEGLDSLEPIDETQLLRTPPSTVPSQLKRQQARRQLKSSGYPQNQRVTNPKRAQSSHALMLRKNSRGPQVPTGRRPQPPRRIKIAETREEAENAIESDDDDDDDVEEERMDAPKGAAVNKGVQIETIEEVEDDGNEDFVDIETADEKASKHANRNNKLTVNFVMCGDFTPEGHAHHDSEMRLEERRHKSRASQRTLVEQYPKVVSKKEKEAFAISIPYKPTKLIDRDGVVVSYKS